MRVSGYLFLLEQTLCFLAMIRCMQCTFSMDGGHLGKQLLSSLLLSLFQVFAEHFSSTGRLLMLLPSALLMAFGACPLSQLTVRGKWLLIRLMPVCFSLLLVLNGCAGFVAQLPVSGVVQVSLCCCLLLLLSRFLRQAPATGDTAILSITHEGRHIHVTALVDSGNLLCDPISGDPVVVLSQKTMARLMSANDTLPPGTRLLRVRTVSGTALMTILRPDAISLLFHGKEIPIRALLGTAPEEYTGVQALLPSALLRALPTSTPSFHHQRRHI